MHQNGEIIGIMQGPLRRFTLSSTELIQKLESDEELSEEDRLCVENHLLKLYLAYAQWKHRKVVPEHEGASNRGA